tara:strand:+ start:2190 stop:2432 length:243 start_codon:yes stop_codon:yes gene_type:complete
MNMSEPGGGIIGNDGKEWVSRTTWDGKELIFTRQHSCYDLDSPALRDMAEIRIRQCEYEISHWQDLLDKREKFIQEKDKE